MDRFGFKNSKTECIELTEVFFLITCVQVPLASSHYVSPQSPVPIPKFPSITLDLVDDTPRPHDNLVLWSSRTPYATRNLTRPLWLSRARGSGTPPLHCQIAEPLSLTVAPAPIKSLWLRCPLSHDVISLLDASSTAQAFLLDKF